MPGALPSLSLCSRRHGSAAGTASRLPAAGESCTVPYLPLRSTSAWPDRLGFRHSVSLSMHMHFHLSMPARLPTHCRRRGGVTPEDLAALRQPTWCRLLPQHFSLLLDRGSAVGAGRESNPETLLFVHHGTQDGTASSSSSSSSGERPGASQPGAGGTDEFGVPETVAQALAEAALMVADPAATHTAAAVSNLTAGPGTNSSSRGSTAGSGGALPGSAGLAGAAAEQPRSSGGRYQLGGDSIPRPRADAEP